MPRICFGNTALNKIIDTNTMRTLYDIKNPYVSYNYETGMCHSIDSYLEGNEFIVKNNYSVLFNNTHHEKHKPCLIKTNLGNVYLYIPFTIPLKLSQVEFSG